MKLFSTKRWLTIMTGTVAMAAVLVVWGNQDLPWTDSAQAIPPSSDGHAHEGLTWPPQPRGITNIVVHSNPHEEEQDRTIKKARKERLEQKATRGTNALKGRFAHAAVIDKEDKDDKNDKNRGTVVSEAVFFNHDTNTTVEVGFDADEKIVEVNTRAAKDYQPEITEEEIAEAAKLARKYFARQGSKKKIAGLKPYGILAYKSEGDGFYDTRVIYVSFHKHDDAPPQLMAWVDLTNQRILQVREE